MTDDELRARVWLDACLAAELFAVDPFAAKAIVVRARVGPVRSAWLDHLRWCLGNVVVRRMPAHSSEDRLLGGIDLAATLKSGKVIAQRGLLSEADRGVVIVPMAERLQAAPTSYLCEALDWGELRLERDGLAEVSPARIGVVLLDEGIDDERVPMPLADRAAFHLDLTALGHSDALSMSSLEDHGEPIFPPWWKVGIDDEVIEALCRAAAALGVESIRGPQRAVVAARLSAVANDRTEVTAEDVAVAARLVLAPRATRMPAPDEQEDEPPPPEQPDESPESDEERSDDDFNGPLEDIVVEAALSAMPEGLLAQLAFAARRMPTSAAGVAGAMVSTRNRGRPAGIRRGNPRAGGRLNVVATLRAAAPWQPIRRRVAGGRIEVRQDDFRVTHFKRRTETLTIFAVDASGSAAFRRLAEAKGAVEQVLGECYVRRDHVALLAFRGAEADLVLPPTRSLLRAKRCLAGLAGGGTTPLAAGIDSARMLAEDVRRRGQSPLVVLMTDGRANIDRGGQSDRKLAAEDAISAARLLAEASVPALFVDTGPRPRPEGQALAEAMAAHYLHLPYAEQRAIASWVERSGARGGVRDG